MPDIVASKTMFATADGKVVGENDPNAATLIAREGALVPADVVEQYGIRGNEYDEAAVLEAQEAERRQTLSAPHHGQPARGKSRRSADTKAVAGPEGDK